MSDHHCTVNVDDKPLIGALWCVSCIAGSVTQSSKQEYAVLVFNGNSLCEKCFEIEKIMNEE